MTPKEFDELDDEKKMELIIGLQKRVRDKVVLLMSVSWNRINNITGMERSIVERCLKDYGYEATRKGFEEAVAQGKQNLAYVRAIAKTECEKTSVKQNLKNHEQIKQEDSNKYWNPSEDPEWSKALKELGASKQL